MKVTVNSAYKITLYPENDSDEALLNLWQNRKIVKNEVLSRLRMEIEFHDIVEVPPSCQ